jgi:hypothetical protein
MQLLRDHYLVLVDQLFESGLTPSGIITSNTAIIDDQQEDRGEFKRRYGVVMEIPASFSDRELQMIDPGSPAPRRYVGHEWMQHQRTAGYKAGLNEYNHSQYYPSTFERYRCVTCKDISKKVDVEAGEKVYFSENATEPDRFMGRFKGGLLYSIRVDEIICVVREVTPLIGYNKYKQKRIVAQGGWVLVKVDMENWEDIEIPVLGKPREEWLWAKEAPAGKTLRGTIKAAERPDLRTGDKVVFERDADAPIKVEGEDLTCMMHDDILVKLS